MLTKQERNDIAKRAVDLDFTEDDSVYKVLIGKEIPDDTTYATDIKVVKERLIDLCDMSNMVELPLDKDGEVIHINDVIYDNSGEEYQVECIKFF